MSIDARTRLAYGREVGLMAEKLRGEAAAGKISWASAARQAQETRNLVMMIQRSRSTPVGRAIAEDIKKDGKTLNQLIAKKTIELYGKNTLYSWLSTVKKNKVYAAVVASSGTPSAEVNTAMSRLSFAGRGLVFMSLALSVFNITTSNDKLAATGREVLSTGAGVAGGIAGGALAGLACGPAAPVCVVAGAFVGGAMAAFAVGFVW
jgi:hypothetical protein